jgi:Putative addiction module component
MSKTEILEELPKLTAEERHEIRLRLAELDGDGWLDDDDPLTDEEKALIESRMEAHEKNPEAAVPWEEARRRLESMFGK